MARARPATRRTQGVLGGRSAEVVHRVLDAAIAELARSGYAGFRMDEVASVAGVNKTTIYRRWPNRTALVTAVVEQMRQPLRAEPLPDTGALERDLVEAFARRLAFRRKIESRAWARLLAERHTTTEVEAMIGEAVDRRRGEWTTMITRAIGRGEIPEGTDPQLLLHLVQAIVDAHALDPTWLLVAVRTVVAGARAGTLQRTDSHQPPESSSTRARPAPSPRRGRRRRASAR